MSATPNKILPLYPLLIAHGILLGIRTAVRYFGWDPDIVITPYSNEQLAWLQNRHNEWAILLSGLQGQFDTHMPGNKLLHFLKLTPFTFLKNTCLTPLPHASTVFIDESKNGRASYIVHRKFFFLYRYML